MFEKPTPRFPSTARGSLEEYKGEPQSLREAIIKAHGLAATVVDESAIKYALAWVLYFAEQEFSPPAEVVEEAVEADESGCVCGGDCGCGETDTVSTVDATTEVAQPVKAEVIEIIKAERAKRARKPAAGNVDTITAEEVASVAVELDLPTGEESDNGDEPSDSRNDESGELERETDGEIVG